MEIRVVLLLTSMAGYLNALIGMPSVSGILLYVMGTGICTLAILRKSLNLFIYFKLLLDHFTYQNVEQQQSMIIQ